jgi:hypothetical protein
MQQCSLRIKGSMASRVTLNGLSSNLSTSSPIYVASAHCRPAGRGCSLLARLNAAPPGRGLSLSGAGLSRATSYSVRSPSSNLLPAATLASASLSLMNDAAAAVYLLSCLILSHVSLLGSRMMQW